MKYMFRAFFCGLLLLSAQVDADTGVQLRKLLEPMQTLSGKFTQQLIDGEGENLQQSEGEFWLARPGKLNWHTQAPFEQRLVTNSETLWLYDPDLEQVTVKSIDQALAQSPISVLSGDLKDFNQHYAINGLEETSPGQQTFILLPKAADALFEKLTLRFRDKTIASMELLDSLGQTTAIELVDTQLNPEIDAEQFLFDAPPGTDVLVDD